LVFHSSTIAMVHAPINITFRIFCFAHIRRFLNSCVDGKCRLFAHRQIDALLDHRCDVIWTHSNSLQVALLLVTRVARVYIHE